MPEPYIPWHALDACKKCNAAAGARCVKVIASPAGSIVGDPRRHPHPGRRHRRRHAVPPDRSRVASLVHQVMAATGTTATDLAKAVGMNRPAIYKHLSEQQKPMSLKTAERLLGAMGYRLQYRAVPVSTDTP